MSHTSFLGIPVEGDITRGATRVEQRPIEELQPLLEAVLQDPFIDSFGWHQYTPYFNDGEPCEFTIYTPWFRTVNEIDNTELEEYELEVGSHPTLGTRGEWIPAERTWERLTLTPEVAASSARCKALSDAVDSGAFEHVLLDAFGDHAGVTVRRDGITVEFYHHD